jgi:hypothetical protein
MHKEEIEETGDVVKISDQREDKNSTVRKNRVSSCKKIISFVK